MIYAAYGSAGGPAHSLIVKDDLPQNIWLLNEIDVELFSFSAESWDEAMVIYYAVHGWGEYKPVVNDSY